MLLGTTNPSGKLADSWPLTVGHLGSAAQPFQQLVNGEWTGLAQFPADPDGRRYVAYWDDARQQSSPQFCMGWGLSYTTFAYQKLTVRAAAPLAALPGTLSGRTALRSAAATVLATATVRVCNVGPREGTEVVIVYTKDPRGGTGGARRVAPYVKRIVGFVRLPLAAGACDDAVINISADHLATHETDYAGANLRLTVIPGAYIFTTGHNAREDVLNTTIVIA